MKMLVLLLTVFAAWPLAGCGDKTQEGKTPEMDKAFKGGPPPPEVQREMAKTMAQQKDKGGPQTGTPSAK